MWYSICCLPCVHTGIYPSNSTGIVWLTMSEFRWVFPEVYFWMLEFQLQMSDVVMEDLSIIWTQLKFTWHIYDHLEIYDFHLAKLSIKYKCLKFVCLNWILFKNTWISSQNVWNRPRKGVDLCQCCHYVNFTKSNKCTEYGHTSHKWDHAILFSYEIMINMRP